jgi:predicted ATPase
MITLIEAKHYRCFHYVYQRLDAFHVLVGPNASGKTIFLDVVSFLGDIVSKGLPAAINARSKTFHDLLWRRKGDGFELAVEAAIPEKIRPMLRDPECEAVRYEIALQFDEKSQEILIRSEKVLLKNPDPVPMVHQRCLFPDSIEPPDTIISPARAKGMTLVVNKFPNGNDNFYSEVYKEKGKGWTPSFKLGPRKSALANLPADEANFPATTWLKNLLVENITRLALNIRLIRQTCPPGQGIDFKADGANLPWVVDHLKNGADPGRFGQWLAHLKTALPDLENIRTVERPDDRHRYLVLDYAGGLSLPSWMASEGTLRLMALTLPAYLPGLPGIYLIDKPENGLCPRAVDTLFQSLCSVHDSQILMATHSPVILSLVKADKVLCFGKTKEGATDIVRGDEHPALRDWTGENNLGAVYGRGG